MSIRIAIVGPGRVGTVLGSLWRRGGCELHGFLGRSRESSARAAAYCGAGEVLADAASLRDATCVLVAVGDRALADVVTATAAAGAVASGSLWFHASGYFDLSVLQPVAAAGGHVGSLHPVCPVPDVETGVRALPGMPAALSGDAASMPLLEQLARCAGLQPIAVTAADRATYHAACALAANGATALFDLVEHTLLASGGLSRSAARRIAGALMATAVEASERRGAAAALSGPVQRGDLEVVRGHLRALGRDGVESLDAYCLLMLRAVGLARAAGHLSPADVHRLVAALGDGGPRDDR